MPEGRLVIRADAGARMGTGHVMRMIALGQAWSERGGAVCFAGCIGSAPLAARLEAEGFARADVRAAHPDPSDLPGLLDLTDAGDWLALDGYHFDSGYQRALRAAGRKTLVADDVNDRGDYSADVLLNQNLNAESLAYAVNPEARCLLGPRYALLRREFRQIRAEWSGPHAPLRVLVTMGGSDPVNFSATVLRALGLLSGRKLNVRVAVGPANPNRPGLERLAAASGMPVELVAPGEDMPQHMLWADLAVTAAGSTCWELAHLGVPMLAYGLADNQAGVLAGLVAAGAAVLGGRTAAATPEAVAFALNGLLDEPQRLGELSACGRGLVDGQGAFRVAEALRPTRLSLRPARQEDADFLWRLANDPGVRAVSFSRDPILIEEHLGWLAARLAAPGGLFLIAEDQRGMPVGQIRVDEDAGCGVISVSLAAPFRCSGLGPVMISQACRLWAGAHPGQRIMAYALFENAASEKAFAKAGFIRSGERTVRGKRAMGFIWKQQEE